MNRKILVPVLIDEAKIPLAYRRIQAARLVDWQPSTSHPEIDLLLKAIRTIVGEPETPKKEIEREQVRDDETTVFIKAPEPAPEPLSSAKLDEEVGATDSPPPAPVFAPPVQPTSIHSIPTIRHFDRGDVREPKPQDDDPVSFEKVRPERGRSLPLKFAGVGFAGGAKKPLLAAGGLVVLIGIVIAIALNWQSGEDTKGRSASGNENRPASPALSTFEFDVVTLDGNGRGRERRQERAKSFTEELGDGVKLEMVEIPGGEFTMGSPGNEADRSNDEGPQHRVTIQRFFYEQV